MIGCCAVSGPLGEHILLSLRSLRLSCRSSADRSGPGSLEGA